MTNQMNLTIPTINVTTDPTWSQNINSDLLTISDHDHITVGKPIVTAAININDDLGLNGFNLIDIRMLQMQNLSSDPSLGADINGPYVKSGNLWYNNASGAHVQITNGSGLNVSVGAADIYTPKSVTVNYTILNTDTFTWFDVNTTSPRTLFLPQSSTVSNGRFYYIKDVNGFSETNPITITPVGTDTIDGVNSNYLLNKNFGMWLLETNATGAWKVGVFSNADMNNSQFTSNGLNVFLNGATHNATLETNTSFITLTASDGYITTLAQGKILTTSGAGTVSHDGYPIEIHGGSATAGNTNGGYVLITSGDGYGSGAGSTAILLAGNGGATGNGGVAELVSGEGGLTSGNGGNTVVVAQGAGGGVGNGGNITVAAGNSGSVSGTAGAINASAGNAGGGTAAGGNINVTAGEGSTSGNGGNITVAAGLAGATGTGGTLILGAGQGGATSGAGGSTTVKGGPGSVTSGPGGDLNLQSGAPFEGSGGNVNIIGLSGVGTNRNGGSIIITPGGKTGTGHSGSVELQNSASTNIIEVADAGVGFFGATPVVKPTITGSRAGNAALASLLTAGALLGLWTDSTTPS